MLTLGRGVSCVFSFNNAPNLPLGQEALRAFADGRGKGSDLSRVTQLRDGSGEPGVPMAA